MKHAIIFKTLWRQWKATPLSLTDIAKQLNLDESIVSGFLKGEQDIRAYIFLELVGAMPWDFQLEYWQRVARKLERLGFHLFSRDRIQNIGDSDTTIAEIAWILKGLGVNVERLWEMLADIPKAVQASIPSTIMLNRFASTIAGYKLTTMIQECVEGKTEAELRKQMEFLCLQKIDWDLFQEMIAGKKYPQTKLEIEELKVLVDPGNPGTVQKYSLFEWVGVFWVFDRQIPIYRSPSFLPKEDPENQV